MRNLSADRQLISMMVNRETWERFRIFSRENGLPMSRMIELLMRASLDSQSVPMIEVMQSLMVGFAESTTLIKNSDRAKVLDTLNGVEHVPIVPKKRGRPRKVVVQEMEKTG